VPAGIDPIKQRHDKRRTPALDEAKSISFEACASEYFEANKDGWRSASAACKGGALGGTSSFR